MIRHLLTARGAVLNNDPWEAYPRPQMVREDWQCLNGRWRFGTDPEMKEEILVPFCPESLLSGVRRDFDKEKDFYYEREFELALPRTGRRVLLHFGAVDQVAEVSLNDRYLGRHVGGYLPFTFDITNELKEGTNRLSVKVTDGLSHVLPWGKQKKKRGGMWYTPVSGIWQTVWMESVPADYIRSLKIEASPARVQIRAEGADAGRLVLDDAPDTVYELENGCVSFTLPEPHLWSPEDPYLYRFTLSAGEDSVRSYFALRELSVKEVNGKKRMCLNGEPYFFHGLLDQGYWSDGIYTPAAPECYEEDILTAKELGFNTLRKHIKIEPEQFYYDCDRLGMIVFQDMVNTGSYDFLRDSALPMLKDRLKDEHINTNPKARANFLKGMHGTVQQLGNHPCICYWTIFNEGWGQFKADEAYEELLKLDGSRFIDATSGWYHQTKSDVDSLHIYFRPLHLGSEDRPQMLSEFGGYVWKDKEHSANYQETYGYKILESRDALAEALRKLYMEELLPLAVQGMCGAIYTQLSDVEDETNGMLTYDRKVCKIRPEEFADIAPLLQAAVRE